MCFDLYKCIYSFLLTFYEGSDYKLIPNVFLIQGRDENILKNSGMC